jgi:Uma2 family endonuclease
MSSAATKYPEENQHYTYADYRQWELAEGERYELIDGVAYAMSAPNDEHQAISMEICRQIANYLKAGVQEYWVVSPMHKTVQVFLLQQGTSQYKLYDALDLSSKSGTIVPSSTLEGLNVSLNEVFAK